VVRLKSQRRRRQAAQPAIDTKTCSFRNSLARCVQQAKHDPGAIFELRWSVHCTDTADVIAMIEKAGTAYGALSDCLFNSTSVSHKAKAAAYTMLVLSILLYGSESWAITGGFSEIARVPRIVLSQDVQGLAGQPVETPHAQLGAA
jgi:hypothetical protein